MEGLEHEAHAPAPQLGPPVFIQLAQILTEQFYPSRARLLKPGGDSDQRRLSGPGGTHQRHLLALAKGQAEITQNLDRSG